jgi:hypothetical protein
MPIMAMFQLDWVADYTNINATATMYLTYPPGQTLIMTMQETAGSQISDMLAAGHDTFMILPQSLYIVGGLPVANDASIRADFSNQPFNLQIDNKGSGDLTGGNSGNRLLVTVWYALHRLAA